MPISQKNRPIQIATPLGEDVLLFYRMQGSEKLGALFEYELEMLSENAAIDPDKLLGENITVGVQLLDSQWRYFNGYVARFGQYELSDGFSVYRATLRPWLWFLSRAANCRIFQQKNVPDIIKQVFRDQGFSDLQDKLSGSYAVREYCVQYRETDLNFASRLMEEEGIYYYFTHENGKHHLVLADSPSAHDKFPGYETIPYHPNRGDTDKTRTDHIHEWTYSHGIQPGAHVLTDYDFKKPKADLMVKSAMKMHHAHAGYERFDYPGRYVEIDNGENLVRSRTEERRARFESFEGHCNARGLGVGRLFKLTGHRSEAQNRHYVIVSANYQIRLDSYIASSSPVSEDDMFQCSFTCLEFTQTYRPPRKTIKSLVQGPQTAVVVGPAGDEIYTDQYGRVKVQFHWDRYGKKDENSSCWIRVAHPWAGKNWGMVSLPRIGQEVVVDFLEGDPDRPLITGSVYNNSQMPPYALPANKTQSGIKSRSSKGGGADNFNEIRFEDKKGHEEILIHAEHALTTVVEASESRSVGGSRTTSIHKDEKLTIKDGNRTETLEKGSDTLSVGGSRTASIHMDDQLTVKDGNRTGTLEKGSDKLTATLGNITIEAPAGKYGLSSKDVEITGTTSIKLVCGASTIEMTPASITIKSPLVKIN